MLDVIRDKKMLSDEVIERLDEELKDFAKIFGTGKAGQLSKRHAAPAKKAGSKKAEVKKAEVKKAGAKKVVVKKPAKRVEEEE